MGRRHPSPSGQQRLDQMRAGLPQCGLKLVGVRARLALCRLAMPFPSPGPRWSRVAAGRPVIRP